MSRPPCMRMAWRGARRALVVCGVGLAIQLPAWAGSAVATGSALDAPPAAEAPGERAHILAERARIEAEHARLEIECRTRFAVTACVDDVRARQRLALAPLRERELALDALARRQRAEQRRAAVAAKQASAAALGEAVWTAPIVPPSPAPAERAQLRPERPAAPTATAAGAGARKAAQAEARAQAAQRRQASARVDQDRVAHRLILRSQQGRPAAPLPTPASAAAR